MQFIAIMWGVIAKTANNMSTVQHSLTHSTYRLSTVVNCFQCNSPKGIELYGKRKWNVCCGKYCWLPGMHHWFFLDFIISHCIISLLMPFEEDVCAFLIFSYSFIGQKLLLKQFCSNCLSFKDSLLTSSANPAQRGRTGCAG